MRKVIVAFAFGAGGAIRSNQTLGEELNFLLRNDPDHEIKAVYTQSALGLGVVSSISVDGTTSVPIYCIPQPNEYQHPSTLCIARWAVDMAAHEAGGGINQLIILAAPPHKPRCMRDILYATKEFQMEHGGSQLVEVKYWQKVASYPADHWFCQNSDQPRTRSWFNWWSREWILLAMPMWLYAKVAG